MGLRSVGDLCNDIAAVIKGTDHNFLQCLLRMAAIEAYDRDATIRTPERAMTAGGVYPLGIWDWDVPRDRSYVDSDCAGLFGVSPRVGARGVSAARLLAAVHRDDLDELNRRVAASLAKGGDFSAQYRVIANGTVRWVYAKGRCTLSRSGRPERFPGAVLDITQSRASGKR